MGNKLVENLGQLALALVTPKREQPKVMVRVNGRWLPVANTPSTSMVPQPQTIIPTIIEPEFEPTHRQMQRYAPPPQPQRESLSLWLERGRHYHHRAYRYWVETDENGTVTATCALVAMYAGAFGPHEVFSGMDKNMIIWRLGQRAGISMVEYKVMTPYGRKPLHEAVIGLNDAGWTRKVIAEWLATEGL
jgi:hypothetical protein